MPERTPKSSLSQREKQMADDLQRQREEATSIPVPVAISGFPEGVMTELPTEDELGVEDDKPVQSTQHRKQSDLLLHLLDRVLAERENVCIAGDLAVHYRHPQPPVVPDVMVVFGVPKRERSAYLVWTEGKGPDWVLELLSPSTAAKDREKNYSIYEQQLRVPEYVWFNPLEPAELRGFRLRWGRQYEEVPLDEKG
jgi:Uma2 family endonuclease